MRINLKEMFQDILQICPTFIIYDYGEDGRSSAIKASDQITGNLQEIRRFFSGFSSSEKAGDLWCDIYVGCDDIINALSKNIRWWFQDHNAMLLPKELQVRDGTTLLWIIYSHEHR